jgi:hypothetical protein
MAIRRTIEAKFSIINKKLDAILSSTDAVYPLIGNISGKALKAAKGGDRNKANDIIMKDTLCTKAQAEALVKLIEQQVVTDLNANCPDK